MKIDVNPKHVIPEFEGVNRSPKIPYHPLILHPFDPVGDHILFQTDFFSYLGVRLPSVNIKFVEDFPILEIYIDHGPPDIFFQ